MYIVSDIHIDIYEFQRYGILYVYIKGYILIIFMDFSFSGAAAEVTGETHMISHYGLEHSYNKFSTGKKFKDQLSAFLPHLPGT